jgi:monoamine oxidase
MDRRTFLKKSSLIAMSSYFPALALADSSKITNWRQSGGDNSYDVVIVGAGIAGLTCAYLLNLIGIDNIKVVEANSRVGGRTESIVSQTGAIIEAGAQWIGPQQWGILSLMDELGIDVYPNYGSSAPRIEDNLNLEVRSDYEKAKRLLDRMARQINLESPWQSTNADYIDSMSLGDWLSNNLNNQEAAELINAHVASQLSASVDDISLLYYLFYLKSSGSYDTLAYDAQMLRVKGGAQSISLKLADILDGKVLLDTPVIAIDDSSDAATIQLGGSQNRTIMARKVIVAMMPKDANKIHFIQGLPETRQNLQAHWITSSAAKVSIVYERPFWRPEIIDNLEIQGIFSAIYDNSHKNTDSGIIMGFPSEGYQSLPSDPDNRIQLIANSLAEVLGEQAFSILDFSEKDWAEEDYISGAVSPLPKYFLTSYGKALRKPVGNIHWAGAETSVYSCGYMDGAVNSAVDCVVKTVESMTY